MKPVRDEIRDLLSAEKDDRFLRPNEVRKKAMDLLARREYGGTELAEKLASKGYERSVVEVEIGRLADEGLQSDSRFAESFVQARVNQGKGPVRIRSELARRGLSAGIIDGALDGAACDWFELAHQERVKKFGHDVPQDFKEKARQMRFLQYRGFERDHIQKAF